MTSHKSLFILPRFTNQYKRQWTAYRRRIKQNQEIISSLHQTDYPFLYKALNGYSRASQRKLTAILFKMRSVANQHNDGRGNYWVFASVDHMAKTFPAAGRSTGSWHTALNLFDAWGLIYRYEPTDEDAHRSPYFQSSLERQRSAGLRRPAMYYLAPAYSEQVLRYAEDKARVWNERGAKKTGFSKVTLIETYGQRHADAVSRDKRRKPNWVKSAEKIMKQVMRTLVKQQGYAFKEQVITGTTHKLLEAEGIGMEASVQGQFAQTDDRSTTRYFALKARATRIWQRRGAILAGQCKMRYSPPNSHERAQYKLPNRNWIIRRIHAC